MKESEILTQAKALIEDKANWTTVAFARDEDGQSISPMSEEAVRFCAMGALARVCGLSGVWFQPMVECLSKGASSSVVFVNELCGHDAVIAMFDASISIAKTMETGERNGG